jgi:uncharacterized protein (TIGR02145 family)
MPKENIVKKYLIYLITLFLSGSLPVLTVYAQAPEKFAYQAQARDAYGNVIKGTPLDVKITILAGSLNGSIVWEGFHKIKTDKYGLFTLNIGEGRGGTYHFSAIDWAHNSHFLNVKVTDIHGNTVDMGTTQFLSVPYALYGKDEDSDPKNEIQELMLEGNRLSISGGNSVTLSLITGKGSYYFADHDGDGFGNRYEPLWVPLNASVPKGYSENEEDCNDQDSNINPDAEEISGDGIDADCDGFERHVSDIDDDEDGYTENNGDCDDNDPARNPGTQEICGDGIDQDCSGEDLDCNDLEGRLASGENVADLIKAGFSIMELFNAGAGVGAFEQSGIPQQDLIDLGLTGTLTDASGNEYKWVRIGNQYWMAQNLYTLKYNDGKPIKKITSDDSWKSTAEGAYSWYLNAQSTDPLYGPLYNWFTVESGNLCPSGWHVPTEQEFGELIDHLGGTLNAGIKLKDIGTQYWSYGAGSNESGFKAVGSGYRYHYHGRFYSLHSTSMLWSASESDFSDRRFARLLYISGSSSAYVVSYDKNTGASVRCIKD